MKDGADKYDPRVIVRIRPGETMTAANYIELMKLREERALLLDELSASADQPEGILQGEHARQAGGDILAQAVADEGAGADAPLHQQLG